MSFDSLFSVVIVVAPRPPSIPPSHMRRPDNPVQVDRRPGERAARRARARLSAGGLRMGDQSRSDGPTDGPV